MLVLIQTLGQQKLCRRRPLKLSAMAVTGAYCSHTNE